MIQLYKFPTLSLPPSPPPQVDPFDKDSPIKQSAISKFPRDMFFVLRVVQLLRGLATGMGVTDFSTAQQWAPLAQQVTKPPTL